MSDQMRQHLVGDFLMFWLHFFPEQIQMTREQALLQIHEAKDGGLSNRADEEMSGYQDRVAGVYGAYEAVHFQEWTFRHLLMCLPTKKDLHVVSLGCGPASYELFLLENNLIARVTLVDHSPAMLARAMSIAQQLQIADRVTTIVADATKSNLTDNSADVVLCINSMHWSQKWRKWVQEASRIAKPGGICFVTCSLGMPRSNIQKDQFVPFVRKHFGGDPKKDGFVVPPLQVGGQVAFSSRYYVFGKKIPAQKKR